MPPHLIQLPLWQVVVYGLCIFYCGMLAVVLMFYFHLLDALEEQEGIPADSAYMKRENEQ